MNTLLVNPAATFGQIVLAVAGFVLVYTCMKLAAASTESAKRNKKSNGWPLEY